jgi:hypothetical protein
MLIFQSILFYTLFLVSHGLRIVNNLGEGNRFSHISKKTGNPLYSQKSEEGNEDRSGSYQPVSFSLKNQTHHELHFPNVDYSNTTTIAFSGK